MKVTIENVWIQFEYKSLLLKCDLEQRLGESLDEMDICNLPDVFCRILNDTTLLGKWEYVLAYDGVWFDGSRLRFYDLKSDQGSVATGNVKFTSDV